MVNISYRAKVKNFILIFRFAAFSLLAATCLCTTGCLHYLGLNRSSLTPRASISQRSSTYLASVTDPVDARTADKDHMTGDRFRNRETTLDSETTFRSQDSTLSVESSSSGHSQTVSPTISLGRLIQSDIPQQQTSPISLTNAVIPAANSRALSPTRQRPAVSSFALQPNAQGALQVPDAIDRRPDASESAITLQPASNQGQNSIGFNVDQLRAFMNQRSLNPMSSGEVLADKKARWDILNAGSASGHSSITSSNQVSVASNQPSAIQIIPGVVEQNPTTAQVASNPFHTIGNRPANPAVPNSVGAGSLRNDLVHGDSLGTDAENVHPFNGGIPATAVSLEHPFPPPAGPETKTAALDTILEDAAAAVNPDLDDSMLGRLKGLYDPNEDGVASRIWLPQIPKLPNPWSVFRDREKRTAATAAEANRFAEVEREQQNSQAATTPLITPVPAVVASEASSLLSQLVIEYETRLAHWPKTPAERLENPDQFRRLQQELRLLYLIQDRPEDAASAVDSLSPGEQEFFQSLVLSLAEYRKAQASDSPSVHYTGAVHQLRAAVQALSPLADLRIRRLEICSRIHSYGRIDTFPSNDFDPGRPLLLYVEMENFGSQLTPSGRYLASFDATLQIVEKNNGVVKETIRLTDITDEATSARTDYFQSYDLTLPSHLMTGEYEIRLKIRDKLSTKTTEKSVGFQVR